mmetsp:Transcript_19162/g.39462  ORF Transcript_19162/g.39462 Transcript_19162/m.39462 type:complete len:93 (-) Transcript_19162:8-286(-)
MPKVRPAKPSNQGTVVAYATTFKTVTQNPSKPKREIKHGNIEKRRQQQKLNCCQRDSVVFINLLTSYFRRHLNSSSSLSDAKVQATVHKNGL